MELQTKIIPVSLSDGTVIKVEATLIDERKMNFTTQPFTEVTKTIESLTKEIAEVLQKVKPDQASVKFNLVICIESGKITTLLVQGNSTANLEITLEWKNQ